jgi:hypothetical protein
VVLVLTATTCGWEPGLEATATETAACGAGTTTCFAAETAFGATAGFPAAACTETAFGVTATTGFAAETALDFAVELADFTGAFAVVTPFEVTIATLAVAGFAVVLDFGFAVAALTLMCAGAGFADCDAWSVDAFTFTVGGTAEFCAAAGVCANAAADKSSSIPRFRII